MPEALARADHDFILREDARPARSRRTPVSEPERNGFMRLLLRKPGRTLLVGGAAILLTGIGVNALFLQNSPHPAPFFHARDKAEANRQAQAVPADAPVPPVRPAENAARPAPRAAAAPAAERSQAPVNESRQQVAAREPARQNPPAPVAAKPDARPDAIGALLREGRVTAPTPPASIPNPTADQTKRILAVQEALKKLGHGIKPDGVAGPSTRVAIEQFERTRNMQVTGQMSPKLLRELASKSGVKIP